MSFLKKLQAKIKGYKEVNALAEDIVLDILVDNQHILIGMNTDDQLFTKGVDADNIPIMDSKPYSPYTVAAKKRKGQPTNRVTLRDSGDFHGDFVIKRTVTSVQITSTNEKAVRLTMKYGDAIFGLIPENFEEVKIKYVKAGMLKRLKAI
jgi:hypothetical protein